MGTTVFTSVKERLDGHLDSDQNQTNAGFDELI